jgi:hypothetical protein
MTLQSGEVFCLTNGDKTPTSCLHRLLVPDSTHDTVALQPVYPCLIHDVRSLHSFAISFHCRIWCSRFYAGVWVGFFNSLVGTELLKLRRGKKELPASQHYYESHSIWHLQTDHGH